MPQHSGNRSQIGRQPGFAPQRLSRFFLIHPLHMGWLKENDTVKITCRIIVKFNVAATAVRGGNVAISVSPPTEYVQAKLSAQQNNNSTGDRGNTIEVDLDSIDTHVCPPISEKTSHAQKKSSDSQNS